MVKSVKVGLISETIFLVQKPVADIVYLPGIKNSPNELLYLKNILKKKANLFCFQIDYSRIKKVFPKIKKRINQIKSNGVPLVLIGLSIGAACAIIFAKETKSDLVVSINSFYDRKQLFKERKMGKCKTNLSPFININLVNKIALIYSENDKKVSPKHSLMLFEFSKNKKSIHCLKNSGHNCASKKTQENIAKIIFNELK